MQVSVGWRLGVGSLSGHPAHLLGPLLLQPGLGIETAAHPLPPDLDALVLGVDIREVSSPAFWR